jgi:hypothetical protein
MAAAAIKSARLVNMPKSPGGALPQTGTQKRALELKEHLKALQFKRKDRGFYGKEVALRLDVDLYSSSSLLIHLWRELHKP